MGTGQMQPQGSSLFEAPATGDASSLTHEGVSGSFNSSPRLLTPPSQGPARTSQGGQDGPHLSGCLAGGNLRQRAQWSSHTKRRGASRGTKPLWNPAFPLFI